MIERPPRDGTPSDGPGRRGPTLIDEGVEDLPPAPVSAAEAPPVDEPVPPVAAALNVAAGRRGRASTVALFFWSSFLSLCALGLGLWFWQAMEALLAQNIWLGRVALALAGVAAAALSLASLREFASLSRIRRIDALRERAEHARAARDRAQATVILGELERLYRTRPELEAPLVKVTRRREEILDGDALIDLAERELMTPLDEAAAAETRRSARNIAAATAFVPLALIDVLAALWINLSMIRRIAEIYGGRAGWLGSWRLLRAVAAHLVAAGAMAVGDDLIGPALGGGAISRLSRRFGEGLVNGALTARIGVAAMEICRPLPFSARARPRVSGLLKGALTGLFPRT